MSLSEILPTASDFDLTYATGVAGFMYDFFLKRALRALFKKNHTQIQQCLAL